jgi:site-specific recombinase
MDIAFYFAVLAGIVLFASVAVAGYPATLKRIALAIYSHASKTERMQNKHASDVNVQWTRQLGAEEQP